MKQLKLEEMTLEQKIGMVLCARSFTDEDMEFVLELVKKGALGAAQPNPAYPGYKEKIKAILDAADYPIIMVEDAETGFPGSDLPKSSLNALAACNKPEYLRAFAKGIVRDAKKLGFVGTWGPIIDILECNAPATISRVFSDDWERVARLAEEIATIFNQNHYFSCGKHYPGSAGISVDGHMSEVASEFTEEYIMEKNLAPYKYLLEKNLLPTVMVGHTLYKNIDPDYPASLSKKILDMLRNIGFDGVIFSDSFAMMNILQGYGEENVYGMAVAAGVDIVLPNYRRSVKECYNMLMKNFKDGVFTEERLDEAVRRVLKLQEFISQTPENPTEFTAEDEEILNNVARDCITAITDEGVTAALPNDGNERLFVVVTEIQTEVNPEIPEVVTARWYNPQKVADRIRENFPGSRVEFISEFPGSAEIERLLNIATDYKEVVVATFCYTTCYLGTDGLTRRTEEWINSLQRSGKVAAVVHFGNPFALEELNHVSRRIFGYTMQKSQEYAIDVLAGKLEAKGTLPFAINLK